MPPIVIDYQQSSSGRRWGWLLFALAALVAVHTEYVKVALERDIAALEAHVEGKRQIAAASAADKSGRGVEAEIREAQTVMRQLAMPWDAFFNTLERTYIDNIALLAVQPDVQNGSMVIIGEAKEYDDVLAYVTRLRGEKPLSSVHLVGNEVRESDPQRPLQFTVSAQWRPGL